MTNLFLRRPIFAMVISIIVVILGLVSLRGLPVEQYPDITPPNVEVSAVYQGADALTVDDAVATPIGQSIMGVSDMLYMQTTSASDGTMSLTATFAVGSDPDMNAIFTQNNVSTATPMLPAVVRQQGVTTTKSMSGFLLIFALYSDGRYDDNFLSNYAYINIRNELLKINGVGKVSILGAGEYSMRIWIKPDVLSYLNISLGDITAAIEAQSGLYPAGKLGGEPSPRGTEFTYTVTMPAAINSAQEYGNIVIRSLDDGSQVLLSDIATVELGSQSYGVSSTLDGDPATMVAIYQTPGSNAMQVGAAVKARMSSLSANFNDGVQYKVVVDSTKSILSGIDDIVVTLIIALVLVVLIIYLFIQDLRAMIIPVVAIPVSLIGAFMLFPLLGFSINIFSLLGLILAIGLVVDDAIVVTEAVQVNIATGMEPKAATRAAMHTVSSPIIATTIVLVAVFVPVSLMGGITGQLYQQFAITIALSVVISAFNALTLSPVLCSLVLRAREPITTGFFGTFNRWFARRTDGYTSFTKVVIGHGWRTVIFVVVVGGAVFGLTRAIPGGFIPDEDQGYLMVAVDLPSASSLERTTASMEKIEGIISRIPAVEYIASVAGFNLLSGVVSSNSGILFVTLKDYSERNVSAGDIADMLNGELYVTVSDAQAFAFQSPPIPGLGTSSGISMLVQDRSGNGVEYMGSHADAFIARAKDLPEISSVTSQFDANVPQRSVVIDRNHALEAGVPIQEIHNALATFLGGAYINNFNRFGQIYQTYIQSEADYRQSKNDLTNYFVTNTAGQSVPLSSFVLLVDTVGVEYINRFNLFRSVSVNAAVAKGYSTGEAMDALEQLAGEVLPSDMGVAWSGMSFQEKNASSNGIGAFAIALVFVFLILAALYESWSLPLSILLGVPFAMFGAMIFMLLAHLASSIYIDNIFMQISLIMLIGLSAKNAILIVEYANVLYFEQGKSLVEAAIGGARLRFRPILMTALAFLLGVSPLLWATGSSSVAQRVMGVSLVGGMAMATLLGIFVYPSLYALIGRLSGFDKIRAKRLKDSLKEASENEKQI